MDGVLGNVCWVQVASSGGIGFPAEHSKILQGFGEDLLHDSKSIDPGRVGVQGELWRSDPDTLESSCSPERAQVAGYSVSRQRSPETSGSYSQQAVEPLGDEQKSWHMKFPGEHELYHGPAWRSAEEGTLTADVLPSREDLVRRLLPGLPHNCAALLMKSSIESLYDDSMAAVSSSHAGVERHPEGGDSCTTSAVPGRPCKEVGTDMRACTPSKCPGAAAGSKDNGLGAGSFHGVAETGVKMAEANEDPFVQRSLAQGDCGFEETRRKALEAAEQRPLTAERMGDGGNQSEAVVYVVREEWEAFTLYYCSHTGVVRAVASEVSRVTARNNPPDLCRGLPTMAVGGAGCQQCRKQHSRQCSGWWRSRYVLLRVTVTLADRSSGGSTLQGGGPATCCENGGGVGEGGASGMDSWPDGRFDQKKSGTKLQGGKQPSFASQLLPCTSQKLGFRTHLEESSVRGRSETSNTQPGAQWSQKAALLQHSQTRTPILLEQPGDPCTSRGSSELPGTNCIHAGPFKSLRLAKHLSIPPTYINEGAPFEPGEFALEPFGPSYGATNHAPPLAVGGNKAEVRGNEAEIDGGNHQTEVTLAAFLKERPVGRVSKEEPAPSVACRTSGVSASMKSSIAVDFGHETGVDTWAANERRSRLASLLSSPCDSFEGFVSSGPRDGTLVEEELSSNGNSTDCPPTLPYLWAPTGGLNSHEVPDSNIPSCGPSQQQLRVHGETKFRERGWQYAGTHRIRRRGLRRTFKSQTSSCIDSAGGVRRALAQCYAICASTIGVDAVAEAQNSYLGLCVEERELAAVFLDFVALVAPGAINPYCEVSGTRCGRKTHGTESVGGIRQAVYDHARGKRKQVRKSQSSLSLR